jgi:Asp-tRNA(Asn)/Glu-tRNA(Gln) amidotransferase A subunit family amidase
VFTVTSKPALTVDHAAIDLVELTVERAQWAFSNGRVTSEALTKAFLDRIRALNPQYNAIVFINPSVTVPAGYHASGAPFCLIFVGQLWSEANLLSFAYAYECATLHRRTPILSDA